MTTRADIFTAARGWLDTPYHHLARLKGVGVDCVGLPIGVAWELGLVPRTFDVKGYARVPDGRMLMRLAREYMVERLEGDALIPGVVIAAIVDVEPQHFGILAPYRHGGLSIIHALATTHPPRVVETRFMPSDRLRVVAAFDLPGVTE